MKIEMEKWEITRVKEKIGKILETWHYDLIEMRGSTTKTSLGMSVETFMEQLERELSE